jgi:predicted ribosome quality control (RQC) complex YloA/Tae2 family protein
MEGQLKAGAMDTEEDLNKQLKDIVAKIDKAKRELKALRRHQAEGTKGKPGASFITGKEWKIEADEAAKQLDVLRQREREIRTKLDSGSH